MNTAIPKVGKAGIDMIYAFNGNGMLDGAIQALKAAGFKPGENVLAIGGNCWGNFTPLEDGSQYSTMVVGGVLEGEYMMKTIAQYLNNPRSSLARILRRGRRTHFRTFLRRPTR